MDSPGRGETVGVCERTRAFIGDRAPWSIKISPQEVEGPVPRAVGDERFESREAGRAGTPSITVPATVSAAAPPAAPASELEELPKYLPKGSVYLWAARMDGAAATDAIAGWIILMVRGRSYIVWSCIDYLTPRFFKGNLICPFLLSMVEICQLGERKSSVCIRSTK